MYTDAGERAFEALGEIACVFLEPLMPRYRPGLRGVAEQPSRCKSKRSIEIPPICTIVKRLLNNLYIRHRSFCEVRKVCQPLI